MDFSLAEGAVAGPSAPPTEGGASAPLKKGMTHNEFLAEELGNIKVSPSKISGE